MNTDALIWMLTVDVTVTLFTGYFFYKVLFAKPKTPQDTDDSEN